MPLRPPNLDDRSFAQLLESAVSRAKQTCPEWTDYSAGDPGVVLLELFSFLTETMLFQLNRLPDKAYIEFLRLLGVQLLPPSAARVTLRFARSPASGGELRVHPEHGSPARVAATVRPRSSRPFRRRCCRPGPIPPTSPRCTPIRSRPNCWESAAACRGRRFASPAPV